MIGFIEGAVKAVIRNTVIIENGGIGYRIRPPAATLSVAKEGAHLLLWTHLAVRENANDLFGFETREELLWFELLLTVSGIGPRSALAILSSVDIRTLESAIISNDASILARAFGVGKKTADKIVLELKEKVAPSEGETIGGNDGEVVDALIGLGYSTKEARDAARAIPKGVEGEENRIREALRLASGVK